MRCQPLIKLFWLSDAHSPFKMPPDNLNYSMQVGSWTAGGSSTIACSKNCHPGKCACWWCAQLLDIHHTVWLVQLTLTMQSTSWNAWFWKGSRSSWRWIGSLFPVHGPSLMSGCTSLAWETCKERSRSVW